MTRCPRSRRPATSPPTPWSRSQEQGLLWRHFKDLPERCQQLLRVIALAERPDYAQVADALGMPVGSIGPTRGRCLAKLKLALLGDPGWATS